jgi:hypothetical protein
VWDGRRRDKMMIEIRERGKLYGSGCGTDRDGLADLSLLSGSLRWPLWTGVGLETLDNF